ncbi:hypothetical protein ABIE87_006471 [Bradyrhizobium diazoefficiens]|uniref:collagen-like triple helix repeat-containing protein n=1 Tax=Bradyrhizobium diazoefficiens TaxID=1355477 RepID=UPI0035185D91
MSQPPPYTPAHSFVSDSSTLANFPGQALDVEFNDIKTTTDAIRANLALIQRDDGALANNSITYDQLSVALQTAGLQPATLWIVGFTYPVGYNVIQSANLYRCLIAHTSGTFATDLAAGKWLLVTSLAAGPQGPQGIQGVQGPQGIQGIQGVQGAGYGGSSTTSLLIQNSTTKTFTTQSGLAYQAGDYVRAKSAANGANYMEGIVTSYAGTSLVMSVTAIGGSGTFADWNFSQSGSPGAPSGVTTLNGQSGAVAFFFTPQGRLTLASGTPVMSASQAAQTTVYYTASTVPIYDGTNMIPTVVPELSQTTTDTTKSPAAVAASKIYDIFVWNDAGTPRATRGPAWTNNTTRGYTLTMVNGILLNTSAITNGPGALRGTWVGTIASNSGSTIDYIFGASASGGTAASFGVWNAYNRVSVTTTVVDSGAAYTYTSATVRQARGSAGNQVSFVLGAQEDGVSFSYTQRSSTVAAIQAATNTGVGFDVTNAFSIPASAVQTAAAASVTGGSSNSGVWSAPIGFHTLAFVEGSDGTNANNFNIGTNNSGMAMLRL